MRIAVVGAGVAGLATAARLAERGVAVEVFEASHRLGAEAASWLAGGMLAPYCEAESADASIIEPGLSGIDWWADAVPGVERNGTLVLAPWRDQGDLKRFARRTSGYEWVDTRRIREIEPDLDSRYSNGLFFSAEAHLDPRKALLALCRIIEERGGAIRFGSKVEPADLPHDRIVDCRGFAARAALSELRGVRGEMLVIRSHEVRLRRPVRLIHPRSPIYVVPRGEGLFMVGATMIEGTDRRGITLRSTVDLLSAAYALHPAFAEAEIVETGAGVRPAFPDNLPRVAREGRIVSLNGMHRHGFLLSPAFSQKAAEMVMDNDMETHR